MPLLQPVGLCSLSFLLASLASAYPNPDPPAPGSNLGFQLDLPEPTTAPSNPGKYGFYARDDSSFAAATSTPDFVDTTSAPASTISPISTSTSLVPVSGCGYINGYWDDYYNLVYCGDSWECVFHASDSRYPGMQGCCSGNDPNNCQYQTKCYDLDDISATPSLSTDYDPLAIWCTYSGSNACQTMVYTDLSITGFACGATSEMYTVATEGTWDPTSDTTYYEAYPTVAILSASMVDASWIEIYVSGTAATATTKKDAGAAITSVPASTSSVHPSASHTAGSSNSGSSNKSSSNTGAIAGGVVGGVVGAAGIGAAAFMWWLLQKKKKHNEAAAATAPNETTPALGGGGPATREHPTSVLVPPQEVEGSISARALSPPPQEVEGSTYRQYAEVDGYSAGQKFPGAVASTDMKPQEMDSKNFIAELPAHYNENRPLSSDTSRPSTPNGRRS